MTTLAALVATSGRVAASASRLVKVRELATFLRDLEDAQLGIAVQYLAGEIPQGRLGIGYATLREASPSAGEALPSLELPEVDGALGALMSLGGTGSSVRRRQALAALFAHGSSEERSFLMRLMVGELRQGALAGVMVDAIAEATRVPVAAVRRAAMYAKNLGVVARAAAAGGAEALRQFQLALMSPIVPMLAQSATDVGDAFAQLGDTAAQLEWKLDGARIQLHKSGENVRLYTRTLNDVTAALPEIVTAAHALAAHSIILDGEAIALSAAGRPLSFQTTMRRFGRKRNVEALRGELPIHGFFFDCLYLDGESLADAPLRTRLAALARAVPQQQRVATVVTSSMNEAQEFYESAIVAGHEGVMAKSLECPYEAGARGAGWLKIKRAHTLDLVILAAEWGSGRRRGKLSNLHLGALDVASGEYVMLGKTFKGLTDAMLAWQTRQLLARETHRDDGAVYVRPELVVEIAFSDLQASRRYPGGIALRLARVKRFREDKTAAQADTMMSVRKIFEAQG